MDQAPAARKSALEEKIDDITIQFLPYYNENGLTPNGKNYTFPEHPSLMMQPFYNWYVSNAAHPMVQKEVEDFIGSKVDNIKAAGLAKKSSMMSTSQRELGNVKYKKKELASALNYFTAAALLAPKNEVIRPGGYLKSPNLALAHGNRSAVFFELGQWNNTLADIEYALEAGHHDSEKLLLRKINALVNQGKIEEAKKVLDDNRLKDSTSHAVKRSKIECLMKNLKVSEKPTLSQPPPNKVFTIADIITAFSHSSFKYEPSAALPSLSAKLEVKIDPQKGRCLVAREPIARGEALLLEMPYCSALKKELELKNCHYCAIPLKLKVDKYVVSPVEANFLGSKTDNVKLCECKSMFIKPAVPCHSCSDVLFCSKTCREAAWTAYHQFECKIVPLIQELDEHLSLRMLFAIEGGLPAAKAVIEAADKAVQKKEVFSPANATANQNRNSSFSASYSAAYQMKQRSVLINPEERARELRCAVKAEVLLAIAIRCGFFGEKVDTLSAEDLHLTRCLLLRHVLQTTYCLTAKSYRFEDMSDITGDPMRHTTHAICPLMMLLLKHSCAPNISRRNVTCNSEGGSLANLLIFGQATRPIKVGEEVLQCIISDNHYTQSQVGKRQASMTEFFAAGCNCHQCQFELANGLDGLYLPFSCDKCKSLVAKKGNSKTSFVSFVCTACQATVPLKTIKNQYALYRTVYQTITQTVDLVNNPLKNLAEAKKELDRLQSMLFVSGGNKIGHISQELAILYSCLSLNYAYFDAQESDHLVDRFLPVLEKIAAADDFDLFVHCYYLRTLVDMMWYAINKKFEIGGHAATWRQWPARLGRILPLMDFFTINISHGALYITSNDHFHIKIRQIKDYKRVIEEKLQKL